MPSVTLSGSAPPIPVDPNRESSPRPKFIQPAQQHFRVLLLNLKFLAKFLVVFTENVTLSVILHRAKTLLHPPPFGRKEFWRAEYLPGLMLNRSIALRKGTMLSSSAQSVRKKCSRATPHFVARYLRSIEGVPALRIEHDEHRRLLAEGPNKLQPILRILFGAGRAAHPEPPGTSRGA